MGANILNGLTRDQVAQIEMAARSGVGALFAELGIGGRHDSDGELPEAPVEMWLDHFAEVQLASDPMIYKWLKRNDTSTALFSEQLEHLLAKMYDRRYPANRAREFLPMASGIPSGAETVASIGFDLHGKATLLSSYGEDVRRVAIDAKKSIWPIIGVAAAWALTVQQARASAMAGVPIDSKGLMAAKRVIENAIDALLTVGDADRGILGFVNQTTGSGGVTLKVAGDADFTALWHSTATAAEILNDIAVMVDAIEGTELFTPTDLVIDTTSYHRMRNLFVVTGSPVTVLDQIREEFGLRVNRWRKLNLANAAGNAPRAILYEKSDEVVEGIVSQEPEQLPSIWTGLGWQTIMHARCGGVKLENTAGIIYADLA